MGVWIGIDGGGTKTKFLSASKDGKRLRTYTTGGTYYHLNGIDTVCARLREGVDAVRCGEPVLGICYGMPSFGEGGAADETAVARIREALAPYPLHVVNDVEVGWAGSMALAPGVNIVAGTGSIAYGRDEAGNSARSGGWMEFFSDEGSGYWLGRRAFQLFAKQSDGRVPRGRLHALMKARLGLEDDYELNNLVRDVYAPSREKTASIQRILLEAAREGDASAVRLYEEAARELAENVNAVLRQLRLGDTPTISYSGGIFETGDLILKPFRAALDASVQVMKPVWEPAGGALLLAVEQFAPQMLPAVKTDFAFKEKLGGKNMALVTTKQMLLNAQAEGYAVGAFNVENMEMVQAVVAAAEELRAPVILQTTPSTIRYADLSYYYATAKVAAEKASVPVAVHLDHGSSFELAMKALRVGYTSIMIDGSHESLEENIRLSKAVADACHPAGVPVEAELGKVGGKEDSLDGGSGNPYTDPSEAKLFVSATGVDFLAVAIGTAHGVYKGVPHIDLERLSEIRSVVDIPLVLHGTSGVPDETVRECIRRGICKVNYATDLRIAFTKAVCQVLQTHPETIDPKNTVPPAGRP